MRTISLEPVDRDRWGRPKTSLGTLTRASTVAKALDDQQGLMNWIARQTAIGLATSTDLIAEAATADPDDNKRLDKVAKAAQERAKSGAGASLGTAIHSAIEMVDRGESTDHLPPSIVADAKAATAVIAHAGMEPLAAELFVTNQELSVGGSFDSLVKGQSKAAILDFKTTAPKSYDVAAYGGLAWAIQLALYAHSQPYCAERGQLRWADLDLPEPNWDVAMVCLITRGHAEAKLYTVDINAGWEFAKLAIAARNARKAGRKAVKLWV